MCFFFCERSRKMRSCLYFGTTSLLYLLIVLIFFCITVWPRMIILSFLLHFFSDAFNRSSQSSFPFLLSRHDMDIIMLKIRCSPWEYILIDTIIHTEHSVNANFQQKNKSEKNILAKKKKRNSMNHFQVKRPKECQIFHLSHFVA